MPMSRLLEQVIKASHATGPDGRGWYKALCPFHDDTNPSLGFTETGFNCLGCDEKGSLAELADQYGIRKELNLSERKIDKTYDYHDFLGNLAYQTVRYKPKSFNARRPDGNGGWIWNIQGVTPIIYRLPEIASCLAGSQIFVAEGEKDVDALVQLGVEATCNPFGAGKFTPDMVWPLHGQNVVIIADKDIPGRTHASKVAKLVYERAASVRDDCR